MSGIREQIEHFEHWWSKNSDTPWKNYSRSRKKLKKWMNRFIRRNGKVISEDETGFKVGRKPTSGWEY